MPYIYLFFVWVLNLEKKNQKNSALASMYLFKGVGSTLDSIVKVFKVHI